MQEVDLIQVGRLINGNPGAMAFLIELANLHDKTVQTLTAYGIRGTDLAVLYSDLCNRDMATVFHAINKVPKEVLIDACSRQDYSGRELIKPYLENGK